MSSHQFHTSTHLTRRRSIRHVNRQQAPARLTADEMDAILTLANMQTLDPNCGPAMGPQFELIEDMPPPTPPPMRTLKHAPPPKRAHTAARRVATRSTQRTPTKPISAYVMRTTLASAVAEVCCNATAEDRFPTVAALGRNAPPPTARGRPPAYAAPPYDLATMPPGTSYVPLPPTLPWGFSVFDNGHSLTVTPATLTTYPTHAVTPDGMRGVAAVVGRRATPYVFSSTTSH